MISLLRNPQVLIQIEKAEDILKRSGVRDFCTACVHGPKGGCCQRCELLGPDGCTAKPLSCAVWLCEKAKQHFPEATKELSEVGREFPTVRWMPRELSIIRELELPR